MTGKLYYDSYAILAYLDGHPGYARLLAENSGVTSYANLLEIHHAVLRQHGAERAQTILERFSAIITDATLEDIPPAMKLRLEHKRKRLSYTDCLGYVIAKRLGIRFLTGDKEFRGLPNVRFVTAQPLAQRS